MGKRGEKQKKKPKIKDKKQSERFKKTAREVGADKPSEGFDLVLKMMGNPEPSKPTGKPTTLLDVNSDGIVKLADGTFWRLALDGGRARGWIGAQVIVREEKMPNPAWTLALVNLETNDRVAVMAAGATY